MQKISDRKKHIKKNVLQVAVFVLILCAALGLFALKAYAASCQHQYYLGSCIHCGQTCQSCNIGQGQYETYEPYYNGQYWHNVYNTCGECGLVTDTNVRRNCSPDDTGSYCLDCFQQLGEAYPACPNGIHTYKDGSCLFCDFICSHPYGSTYEYVPLSSSTLYHTVRAYCESCGSRNYSDPLNGAQVKCEFSSVDYLCKYCDRACSHSSIKTKYVERDGDKWEEDYQYHDEIKYCTSCTYVLKSEARAHSYDTSNTCQACFLQCAHPSYTEGDKEGCQYCKAYCDHTFNSSSVCTNCSYACKHIDTSLKYSVDTYNSSTRHNVEETCNICKNLLSTVSLEHDLEETVSDGGGDRYHTKKVACKLCNYAEYDFEVSHTYNDKYKCTECGHKCTHIFNDSKCNLCGKVCTDHVFKKSVCQVCDYVCNSHNWDASTALCTVCHIRCEHKSDDKGQSFWNDSGFCDKCGYACEHISYDKGKCAVCGLQCPHLTFCGELNELDNELYSIYCSTCSHLLSNVTMPLAYSQYFGFTPSPCGWNTYASFTRETTVDDGYRYFERYAVNEFDESFEYNGSVHILGGTAITDSAALPSTITASRYLVVRLRLSGISHIQLYAYGGNDSVYYEDIVNECSSVHLYNVEYLPENEWVDLVVDMSMFNGSDLGTYEVGSTMSHALMSLCFKYSEETSFVDIEFYALCDDLGKVDTVINYFEGVPTTHNIYLATDEQTITRTVSHSFNSSAKCKNCNYECTHPEKVDIAVNTQTKCGVETRCTVCNRLDSSTVKKHDFGNNTSVCGNCSFECDHIYSGGFCIYCEWRCDHTHTEGSIQCSNCGYYIDYEGYRDDEGLYKLITAIYDGQLNIFNSMLDYDILGINIAALIGSIVALAVAALILKKVL